MSEQTQLRALLDSFASTEDREAASNECRRFLKKVEVQGMTDERASQALYDAAMTKNRKELSDLAEFCKFPLIREGASNMAKQLETKATVTAKWPTL